MHFCYVDEAGDAERFGVDLPDQPPVFALVGMTVPSSQQKSLIWDFLQLKKEFEPRLARVRLSELIRVEVKGSSIRRDLRSHNRNTRRAAIGKLERTLRLVEEHGCQLLGKVVVKCVDQPIVDATVYPRAVSDLAASFESLLAASNDPGVMILDSRTKVKNAGNVHRITTQRFKSGGDLLPHLAEAPLFGHSDTHVPLQIVDVIASGIVFPAACLQYCGDLDWNTHVRSEYGALKERFGRRLQALEYRFVDRDGVRRGGFQVEDRVARRGTHLLFRD
ncbi:DUF3800 domain-containing protein [Tsukamurella sp. NPDC003166]|uniref:DUF3800 domain-containing protein n=1 Tax=Tsukamurella sp. NPDC003166 TaxID=3154444 RepID=UPI0033A0E116